MRMPPQKQAGFTIVELLIVIVVIGILAATTVVAYGGIRNRASNTARTVELRAWEKLFRLYAAEEGHFPTMPNGGYCLGTGFPDIDGSGLGNCRDTYDPPNRYQVNATLNAELGQVAKLPSGPRDVVNAASGSLGPYATYYSGTYVQLQEIVKGIDCPEGTNANYIYPVNDARICSIDLRTN